MRGSPQPKPFSPHSRVTDMTKKPDDAWLAEIQTVKKLGAKSAPTPAMPKMPQPTGTPPIVANPHQSLALTGWYDTPPFPVESNTAQRIAGCAPHLESGLFKKLGQGLIRPTAVLDLHGLGEGDAWMQLIDFLHVAVTRDCRCALIIHGKGTGYGPNRDMGVIKYQIASWLAAHPKVLAFHTSLPQDGGTGALYVYLRRYHHP